MPIFVKVEEYKEVRETLLVLKSKIEEAKKILKQIAEIKDKENIYLNDWMSKISETEKKIEKISSVMQ